MDAVMRAVTSGEDLYGRLGVRIDASDEEIRHAYRSLARRHHPDANPRAARDEGFRHIAAAYEVLGDPHRRAAYDRAIRPEAVAVPRPVRGGPVASHVAPGPTGASVTRGRASSPNPADHAARSPFEAADVPVRLRTELDEWRLVSTIGRVVAALAALVLVAVVVLMLVSASAEEPPPATMWCKTPDGWYDCWEALTPDGS
jgi:DnaJ domain